ncbi:MAG: DUF1015 family protein [Melioribacteraceae bacterium]|nr:DUF1015 family protein [Melioribacteraceae bacterium]
MNLDAKTDPYSETVYKKAKENWERLKKEAPLVTDETPHFYVYKLKWNEQEQVGIAATFSAEDYDNDVILKHEKTRKVKEDDRTNHIVTTEAQTGAVFLTYRGVPEINAAVDKAMNENNSLYDFTAPDGVRHTVWQLPDDFKDIIIFEIEKVKNLYIADGHHRAASASRAQKVRKENNVGHTGEEEYNFFMAVLFPAEQLKILPYNRVVFKFPDGLEDNFLDKLKENFSVEETDNPNPPERRTMCMYYDKKWYLMKPNENVKPGETVGEKLDVSILQNYVLSPLFDIEDPRTDNNVDFIGGIRGTQELEKLVNSGKAKVAFSMYPVAVEDLMNISDAGEIMPPKSTWFEPKLRDGLLVHEIK